MADIFTVNDPWGDPVRLTERKWKHLVSKHAEIAPYSNLIRDTIENPEMVFEALSAPDSKAFYSAAGVIHDRPYRACRVAVIVRYTTLPASIPSAYLPVRIAGKMGRKLQ